MDMDESERYIPESGNPWCNQKFTERVWKNPKWILWPSEIRPNMRIRIDSDALHLFSFTVLETYHNFFLLRGQSVLQKDYLCILYWPLFSDTTSESSTSRDTSDDKESDPDDINPEVEGAPPPSTEKSPSKIHQLHTIEEHIHPMIYCMTRMYLLQNIKDDTWNHIKLNYPDMSTSSPIGTFPMRDDSASSSYGLPYGLTPKNNNRPTLHFPKISVLPTAPIPLKKKSQCVIL